jgi:hypothetical protein
VRVGPAGEHVEAAVLERGRQRVGVGPDLALVVTERLRRRDPEAGGLRRDRVHQRPALLAREERAVDRLGVLLLAEDEARPRAGQGLVGRRGDEVAVRHGVGVQTGGDEPGEMSHVAEEQGPDLVGDLAELVRLHRSRIRRAAADDELGPVLLGEAEHLVVVDHVRFARHAVVGDRVEPAGEVDFEPMGEVAAV